MCGHQCACGDCSAQAQGAQSASGNLKGLLLFPLSKERIVRYGVCCRNSAMDTDVVSQVEQGMRHYLEDLHGGPKDLAEARRLSLGSCSARRR